MMTDHCRDCLAELKDEDESTLGRVAAGILTLGFTEVTRDVVPESRRYPGLCVKCARRKEYYRSLEDED